MIVDATPRLKHLAAEVWRPLTALFLWDCIVTATYLYLPFHAPALPLTLFGSALALFLGFRDNSAYQRWWEGRGLWGLMINASRNLVRIARNYLPDEEARDLQRTIALRQIAYVNALRCQLRRLDPAPDVLRFLSAEEAASALARRNPANGLLDGTGERFAGDGSTRSSRLPSKAFWSISPTRRVAWSG
jgi:putative membrane protein